MEFETYYCPLCGTSLEEHGAYRCLDAWAEGLHTSYEIIPFEDVDIENGAYFIEGCSEDEEYFEYIWEGDLVIPVPHYSASNAAEDRTVLVNELVKSDTPFCMGRGKAFFAEVVIGPLNAAVPKVVRMPGNSMGHAFVRAYIYWRLSNGAVFSNEGFVTESQEE